MFLRANGAKPMAEIANRLGINRKGPGNLHNVLSYEWFHINPEEIVSLTDKGDRAYPA